MDSELRDYEEMRYIRTKFKFINNLKEVFTPDKNTCIILCSDYQQVKHEMRKLMYELSDAGCKVSVNLNNSILEVFGTKLKFISRLSDARGYDRHTCVVLDWRFK